VIGDVRDISRFASREHFAACNGTAPIEVSSGGRITYRLSLRGNRRLNHAIHMAAITQIRNRHSDGRAYYDRKIAEGKTHKEALRSLKRRISNAIYARLRADARQAALASAKGPGRQPGTTLTPARLAHTPDTSSSGKPLLGLPPAYGPPPGANLPVIETESKEDPAKPLTAKRTRSVSMALPPSWRAAEARTGCSGGPCRRPGAAVRL
jgi:transposase